LCDYWHPPVCHHFKKGSCNAGKNCVFLHPGTAAAGAGAPEPEKPEKKTPKKKRAESPAAEKSPG